MKKINSLLFVCLSFLFFAACSKDDNSGGGPKYFIKANVGGTAKTFSANPLVVKINQSGTYSLSMSAGAGGSSLEGMALQINQTSGPITAGTYNETLLGDYVIAATYNPNTSDVSAIYGAGLKISTTAPLQIVISSITDSEVSGTFSGEFFDNSGVGSNSLLITSGEFKLPVQ